MIGTRRHGTTALLSLVLLLTTAAATPAADFAGILRGTVIGAGVRQIAGPLNDFINSLASRHGLATREMTRVVPILSVGDKTYVGAAQVSGPEWRVKTVHACLQIQADLAGGKHTVAIIIPSTTDNPLNVQRVPEVGITALVDSTLWGTKVGPKGGRTHSDLIRAAAIGWVVTQVGDEIDRGIRALSRFDAPSKVVPNLSVGEKSYIGFAQVVGSMGFLDRVDGVVTYEDSFQGKYRVRLALPVDRLDGVSFRRVDGVGVSAFALTTVRKDAARPAPPAPPYGGGVVVSPPPPNYPSELPPTYPTYPNDLPPTYPAEPPVYYGGDAPPAPPVVVGPPAGRGWNRPGHPGRGPVAKAPGRGEQVLWQKYFYLDTRGVERCRKHHGYECATCRNKYFKKLAKLREKRQKLLHKGGSGNGRWDDDDHPGRGHGRGRGRGW